MKEAERRQGRKKGRMKRTLTAGLVIAATALVIGGVFAYYTGRQSVKNTITVGQNTTEIEEEFDPVPDKDVYKKAVWVKNTGDIPCYVRVYLAFSDEEVADVSQLSSDGKTYYSVAEYRDHLPGGWIYNSTDGYLYYTDLLMPGSKTAKLMNSVKTTWRSGMDVRDYELIVREESVQVPANSPGADYKAAWAAFHAGR